MTATSHRTGHHEHPQQPSDADRLRAIRIRREHAPRMQMGAADDLLQLLADEIAEPDKILATFVPEASSDWVQFLASAPADIAFLLSLIERAKQRIRALETQASAPASGTRVDRTADYAAEAAMKCEHKGFARFIIERCGLGDDADKDAIAEALRRLLKISSRSELNAAGRWLQLRAEFEAWE